MDLKSRLIEFIEHKGLSVQSFEIQCNLSNGAVSKMGNNTRRSTIDKISKSYPDLNTTWLLTGEGNMLLNNSDLVPQKSFTVGVPYYNVDFIGGFDLVLNDQTTTPEYLIDFKNTMRRLVGAMLQGIRWSLKSLMETLLP